MCIQVHFIPFLFRSTDRIYYFRQIYKMYGFICVNHINIFEPVTHLPMFSVHLLVLGAVWELEDHLVPTGQHCILLQSGQNWSGTPCVCVCGPDWMTVVMTQSFLWAACFFVFFSKVAALPSRQSRRGEESPVEKGRQKHLYRGIHVCSVFFF